MPSFPKPKFPFDYGVGAEVKALRAHKLFPGDPKRLLEIRSRDTTARAAPSFVRAWQGARAWTVGHGMTVGSTLAAVERANGRPFTLAGFASTTRAHLCRGKAAGSTAHRPGLAG